MKKAFVFLATGCEEEEAITLIDILRRGEVDVQTVAVSDSLQLKSAHGISVIPDPLFSETD